MLETVKVNIEIIVISFFSLGYLFPPPPEPCSFVGNHIIRQVESGSYHAIHSFVHSFIHSSSRPFWSDRWAHGLSSGRVNWQAYPVRETGRNEQRNEQKKSGVGKIKRGMREREIVQLRFQNDF